MGLGVVLFHNHPPNHRTKPSHVPVFQGWQLEIIVTWKEVCVCVRLTCEKNVISPIIKNPQVMGRCVRQPGVPIFLHKKKTNLIILSHYEPLLKVDLIQIMNQYSPTINGNFSILKWMYVSTIFQATNMDIFPYIAIETISIGWHVPL